MSDFFYRTEEIRLDEIKDYFVETRQDREIIDQLKSRNPIVLVGSRGVGKSFLFRIAQKELLDSFPTAKILPVYVTFRGSSLIQTANHGQFNSWMMARICNELLRSLSKLGKLTIFPSSISVFAGGHVPAEIGGKTKIEKIAESFEASWREPGSTVDVQGLPTTDEFLDAIEDLSQTLDIKRFVIFIDEAAHVFLPEQQRQFFTLFRDIRSPYVSCNAAVYPGVTVYGETFQPIHDATVRTLNRDIQDGDYVKQMREIVTKQAEDSTLLRNIERNGKNFSLLAYASSGNPRHLLKTINRAPKMDGDSVNKIIKEYYRVDIWAEHTGLAEKYVGHKAVIDWGRKFIEEEVIPELHKKSVQYLDEGKKTTCFFWMHRDIPREVKESLRLLEYTGVVTEHASGIKATRSETGTRYAVNLGCLIAEEANATVRGFEIARDVTPKRMSEYGANYPTYQSLLDALPDFTETDMQEVLVKQLNKSLDVLDLTVWQIERLRSIDIGTIGDILRASEVKLQEARGIGEIRARRVKNAAITAVFEYISG